MAALNEFTVASEVPNCLLINNPYPVPVNWDTKDFQDAYNRYIKCFEDKATQYAKKNCSISSEEQHITRWSNPRLNDGRVAYHIRICGHVKHGYSFPLTKTEKDQKLQDAQDKARIIYIAKQYGIRVSQGTSMGYRGDIDTLNIDELSAEHGTEILLKEIILKGVKRQIQKCIDDLNSHNFDEHEHETLMVSNFMAWESYWLEKYFNAYKHNTHWNVVDAIPSRKQMESYLHTKMFEERTMRPIVSPVRLHNIIIAFQKFMSRGYFKDYKPAAIDRHRHMDFD